MELINSAVERFYVGCDRVFESLPGQGREFAGFLLLTTVNLGVAVGDIETTYTISMRPLFGVPLLISAIYLSERTTYALVLVGAVLRLMTFKITTLPEADIAIIALNAVPILFFYFILAHFVSTAVGTIRTLSEKVKFLSAQVSLLQQELDRRK